MPSGSIITRAETAFGPSKLDVMKTETTFPLFLAPSRAATASLRCEIVTEFNRLRGIEDAWVELEEQSLSATIFQSLPWLRAWWKAFGKHLDLSTILVRDGSSIVGILPLLRNAGHLCFIGTPGADYCDCLCVEEMAPEVLSSALRTLLKVEGWQSCRFGNLRKSSQFIRCARSLPDDVWNHLTISTLGKRSSLLLTQDREQWIAHMRRKPALKRHRNKLYRSGQVRFRHVETKEEAHRLLNTLFEQHVYRRAMAGEYSQFLSSRWREFYVALVDELDLRKHLRFSVLELDGKPIACHLGFQDHRSLVLYKPTFDVDAWELSPGSVLLSELLGYAREQKLDEVDFTIGVEQYKEHFTNYSSNLYCATLDRSSASAALRCLTVPVSTLTQNSEAKRLFQQCLGEVDKLLVNCGRLLRRCITTLLYTSVHSSRQNSLLLQGQPSTRVQPRMIGLTDLVALAIHQSTPLNARLLQDYRARLRAGDRCYLFDNRDLRDVAWVRRVRISDQRALDTPAYCDVLCEVRSAVTQKRLRLNPGTIDWFLSHARHEGTLACICVSRLDRNSCRIAADANFCNIHTGLDRIIRKAIWHN